MVFVKIHMILHTKNTGFCTKIHRMLHKKYTRFCKNTNNLNTKIQIQPQKGVNILFFFEGREMVCRGSNRPKKNQPQKGGPELRPLNRGSITGAGNM